MANVQAFAGWRYNKSKIRDLSEVIVPPYDVISEAELARLKKQNPFNFSKIILPEGDHKHQTAAGLFKEWRRENVFVRDSKPALYFYKQSFTLKPLELFCQKIKETTLSRTGVLCRVAVEDYAAKIILPHEKTFSGPKADRYKLMEAAQGNMEPVFLGYDNSRFSGEEFEEVVTTSADSDGSFGKPEFSYRDGSGVLHELWPVTSASVEAEFHKVLSDEKLYILDGHHRYETALQFYKDHMKSGNPAQRYVLANVCSFKQPGTVILPTHRAIRGLKNFDSAKFVKALEPHFEMTGGLDLAQAELRMMNTKRHSFALKTQGAKTFTCVEQKREAGDDLALEVLHGEVLNTLSQVTDGQKPSEMDIAYIKDIAEFNNDIEGGSYQLGFLVTPSTSDEVIKVAEASRVMPHKSTFFYPKIPSGLVVNTFE